MPVKSLLILVNELEALNIDWSDRLRPRTRDVIYFTLGINEHEPLTLRQISQILNVSSSQIQRMRSQGISELKYARERYLQEVRELRFLFYFRVFGGDTLFQWLQRETTKAHKDFWRCIIER